MSHTTHQAYSSQSIFDIARTQWQFGDWEKLASTDIESLSDNQEGAATALLTAAALLQCGQPEQAQKCLAQAREWGASNEFIIEVLVAGACNHLARAAFIAGDHDTAWANFSHSLHCSLSAGNANLFIEPRVKRELQRLGMANSLPRFLQSAPLTEGVNPLGMSASETPVPAIVAQHNLGLAWAANTVNTVIFRHHGIFTWEGLQYTAFYVDEATLRVVQRTLATDTLCTHDIPGQYNLRDAHNSISMGIDRSGHLHISYDHHATKLRYRRSARPHAIDAWTDELPMTGANEDKVTYPTFILPRAGYPLTLLYRDGVHNKGSARIKTYDEQTGSWADRPTPILSGSEHKPWTSNAYWNHPAIGSDGSLHLSFVWRTDTIGEEQLVNNVNIGYAWSPDNGLSWFTSRGLPCKLPITQVNADTVWPVSPGSNLINQTSMALDSHNRPHIVFYSNDTHGIPQYQHIWFDGEIWQGQYFSARTQPFTLRGGGTLQIPISRPEVLIDHQDRVYAVYRGDITDKRMVVTQLLCIKTSQQGARDGITKQLWHEEIDYAEPIIDRTRWREEQVLSLLLQRNQQPNGDLSHQKTTSNVWLVDLIIQST